MRRALLLVAAVALVAGCGGSHKPQEIGWAPLRPPAPAPAAGPCSAAQLRATSSFQGGTGGATGQVLLRNTEATPCSLTGRPTFRVVPAVPLALSVQKPTGPPQLPAAWLRSVGGNREASVDVTWFNWCNQQGKPRLKLVLPGGRGTIVVPIATQPRCIVAGTPTTISGGSFAPALGNHAEPWTRLALTARILGPTGDETPALSAHRGGILRYRVELTNASKHTLAFGTCPLFEQQLDPSGPQTYVLNCGSAEALKPGQSAIFAMQITVPALQQLGRNRLFWALDPYSSASAVDADAPVTVQPAG